MITGRKKWLESLLKCKLLSVCSPRNSDSKEGGWGPVICIFFFLQAFQVILMFRELGLYLSMSSRMLPHLYLKTILPYHL